MTKCIGCGKEFFQTSSDRVYCSPSCNQKAWRARNPPKEKLKTERTCLNCSKVFLTSDFRKKCCTPECNIAHQNAQRPTTKEDDRVCPICKTVFKPLQKRGVGRMCCSDICTITWRHGEAAADRARRKARKLSAESRAVYAREWRKANQSKSKNFDLLKEYGITLEDYRRMHNEQGGLCAICGQQETIIDRKAGKIRNLCVDHHHGSGNVRRLLCTRCNQGIGNFLENPESMQKAIEYLKKHM